MDKLRPRRDVGPAGLRYETLAPRARTIHGAQTYAVASIDDVIAMKRAAGRPKDLAHIELLRATAEELADGGG